MTKVERLIESKYEGLKNSLVLFFMYCGKYTHGVEFHKVYKYIIYVISMLYLLV